jgi:hypothetical protein
VGDAGKRFEQGRDLRTAEFCAHQRLLRLRRERTMRYGRRQLWLTSPAQFA